MKLRFGRVLPSLVAAAALALSSGYPLAPLACFALLVLAAVVRAKLTLDRATQRLFTIVVTVLVISGVRAADLPISGPAMRTFALGIALAPLLVATVRAFLVRAEGGRRMDLALALVTLLACGTTRPDGVYVALVVAFVVAVVVSARLADPHRLPLAAVPPRAFVLGASTVVLATALAGASALAAAPLGRFLEARFQLAMTDRWASRTGFSETVRFGRVTKLLGSRTVTLRLSGPRVERLRGVVLDRYDDERWSRSAPEPMQAEPMPQGRPPGDDVVELRVVRVDGERLFLPLDARDFASPAGAVKADSMGSARHLPGERTPTIWFRPGVRDALRVAPSRPADLQIPRTLREPLRVLATSWTAESHGRDEALRALERHLRDEYAYSADYQRHTKLDAVAEFLFVARTGHCEAFASAMVLLARSLKIPARLAVGYRVGERNPVFGHWVVREANAHAWVEAEREGGGWATFDPTPMGELPQDLAHDEAGAEVLSETLAAIWTRAEEWLSERSVFELGGAAVLGLFAFALVRARRRRSGVASFDRALAFSPPLAAYARLEEALAKRGLGRAPGETLERWAARVPEAALAGLIRRYAALRYGVGDAASLATELEAASRQARR